MRKFMFWLSALAAASSLLMGILAYPTAKFVLSWCGGVVGTLVAFVFALTCEWRKKK